MTKIYTADFSREFYVPAEYDVLILFSPQNPDEEFSFKFQTKYMAELPAKILPTA